MTISETTIVRVLLAERAKLAAYIWVIVRDSHLVKDVFQEVALAVQKRAELRDEAALPVWLRRTARFQALAALRDKSRHATQPLTPEILDQLDAYWATQDGPAANGRAEALQECLPRLSPYARQIVALRYGKGLGGSAVAEALGRNVRTIYMALTRIHISLRECIEGQRKAGRLDPLVLPARAASVPAVGLRHGSAPADDDRRGLGGSVSRACGRSGVRDGVRRALETAERRGRSAPRRRRAGRPVDGPLERRRGPDLERPCHRRPPSWHSRPSAHAGRDLGLRHLPSDRQPDRTAIVHRGE